jgi:hypothetical protein
MKGPICKNSTHVGVIPISEIAKGPRTLSFKILTNDKLACYQIERKIFIEIE